jgi:enoyl-[acyl-carrier-protein] reductase (NADH)
MDFLGIEGKTFLVFGVANKKSVAFFVGQVLEESNAKVVYVVRSKERKESVSRILPDADIFICDVRVSAGFFLMQIFSYAMWKGKKRSKNSLTTYPGSMESFMASFTPSLLPIMKKG